MGPARRRGKTGPGHMEGALVVDEGGWGPLGGGAKQGPGHIEGALVVHEGRMAALTLPRNRWLQSMR
eukprot:365572-Chlamydomonas_euryale.AAC.8